jgi:hypothetical protein
VLQERAVAMARDAVLGDSLSTLYGHRYDVV